MTDFVSLVVAGLLTGAVYTLVALGLSLAFGVMRVINFAHGYFVMLGMFTAVYLWEMWRLSPYVSALIVTPAFFLLGIMVYFGLLRPFLRRGAQPIILALATLGLAFIMEQAMTALVGGRVRSLQSATALEGWDVLGIHLSVARLLAAAVALVLFATFQRVLHHTAWGRASVAVAQDSAAAQALGIDPDFVSATMFGAGAALAGVAGALVVTYLPAAPDVGLTFTLISFVIVVLGGLGSVSGAWLGGLIIGVVTSLVGFYVSPGWQTSSYLLVFIVILLTRPQGLFGRKGDFVRETGAT